MAQCGAAVAAALKLKDKKQKSSTCPRSCLLPLGITEPLIFGGNLPRLTPLSAPAGRRLCWCFLLHRGPCCNGHVPSRQSPVCCFYLNGQLPQYLIACAIGFVVAFVLTTVFYKPKEN